MNLNTLYLLVNVAIALGTVLGGFLAFKYGMNRQASEIQERVIKALEVEMTVLKDKIAQLEQANERLMQTISTIKAAMRKRGFLISIDGDIVFVHDVQSTQSTHIQQMQGQQGSAP